MDVVADGLLFPEGPRWHGSALWFSDMYRGDVWRVNPATREKKLILHLEDRSSGLGWLPTGDLLVVSMSARRILRWDGRELRTHAELGGLVDGDLNDMVVDGQGRAYVGNFGKGYAEGLSPEPTTLMRIDPDGSAHVVADDLLFPNGMVITPDGARLIVAEGFAQRLVQYEVTADGRLESRSTFADLDGAIPDGIAVDEDLGVWLALPLGKAFIRVVEGGVVTDRLSVEPYGAFACALGGPTRRTLYQCVAFGSREQIRSRQSKGELWATEVGRSGVGWP